MEDEIYRVLNSTSNGYQLYSLKTKQLSINPNRRKITYFGEKIVIGDYVRIDDGGMICEVLKRENFLQRPRLSNCDEAFVIVSCKEPDFSSYLLDKFLSFLNYYDIKAGIILTKADLLKKREKNALDKRIEYYKKLSYPVFFVNAHKKGEFEYDALVKSIQGKTIAFVGQTGVGKSSLINLICPDFQRKVDALYVNSGRGRHTTKEIILLPYENGFLFDTPGFSELELRDVKSLDFARCFPGYGAYLNRCYFKDCCHLESSKGCAVLKAVEEKELSSDSYDNYLRIREEVKENDLWKKKI